MISRLSSAFAAVLLGLILHPAPAFALSEDVFVVPRVTVQAQADGATAAKSSAQRAGRRRAMDILLRRLTIEEDWIYLPKLAAGMEAESTGALDRGTITLSDRDLELLESGFEVYNEKSSSRTYRAYITYRFKPAEVRRLLKDARIPYSEAQTRTALILPVLQTNNGSYLWEENNPWMAAWKVRPYNNELTPMIAPLGDLEDTSAIGVRQTLALNQAAMQEMAARYSVSQIIVAQAFLQQSNGEDRLRVRLINGYRESGELVQVDGFEPDAGNASFSGLNQGPETNNFIQAKVGDVLSESWYKQPSGNFPALAERAIDGAIAKYSKPWKTKTLIDHSIASLLELSAHYRSLGEWTKIRSALVSTPLIGSVQVKALSRGGAEMLVRAYGDPSKLIIAMESQDLALWTADGEQWEIATPATAQGIRRINRRRRRIFGAKEEDGSAVQPASFGEPDNSAKFESEF